MTDLYPDSPGFKERTTSRDAAEAIKPTAGTLRSMVLMFFEHLGPMTPDELAHWMVRSVLSIRPRVTELYRMGLIERTGERRKNASGMKAHVYRIAKP